MVNSKNLPDTAAQPYPHISGHCSERQTIYSNPNSHKLKVILFDAPRWIVRLDGKELVMQSPRSSLKNHVLGVRSGWLDQEKIWPQLDNVENVLGFPNRPEYSHHRVAVDGFPGDNTPYKPGASQ
ncbi:hypothetical protein V6N13_051445 [Hibiscus sabdariffa]